MDLGLAGRVAIVTAASKGLGRATAEALAAEGAKVVLNARNAAALEDLAATMEDAIVVPGDITPRPSPGTHSTRPPTSAAPAIGASVSGRYGAPRRPGPASQCGC